MRQLVINNIAITTPLYYILKEVKKELVNGKLKDIQHRGDSILITCPHHNDGKESKPACSIYCGDDVKVGNKTLKYGTFNCFVCGFSGSFPKLIAELFDSDEDFAKEWLVERFGDLMISSTTQWEDITFDEEDKKLLDKSIIEGLPSYCPYLEKRGLSKEVCEKFKVKYDPESNCVLFPVYDNNGDFTMITKRSCDSKKFFIPKDVKKPVYLLNYMIKQGIETVYICESQINALTLHSWGFNAVALFGTGDPYQYDLLNKSGITYFILCLDGDNAGWKGTTKLIENLKKDIMIDVVAIPYGKDVNDLTKDEFVNLPIIERNDWFNYKK